MTSSEMIQITMITTTWSQQTVNFIHINQFRPCIIYYLDSGGVPALIFAFTPGAEFLLFALDVVTDTREDDIRAIALVGWDVLNVQLPVGLGGVHDGRIRANALAANVFILGVHLLINGKP